MTLMADWINPIYLKAKVVVKFSKKYPKEKPFPHACLAGFLKQEKAIELHNALCKLEFIRKESDLFSFEQTCDLRDVDNEVVREFVELISSKEFTKFIQTISGVELSGEADAMGVIYRDTDHLLCHDDQLDERKIAYILNLSTDFTSKSGGALALLDSDKNGRPSKVRKRIVPEFNLLNFFTVTNESHHMVEEVLEDKGRLTIGGWLYG